jgi:glycosyltransferase involved in cell wall biosynthesis
MRSPARIAFIMPWPEIGGVERATQTLILLLRTKGYESIAYCTSDAHVLRAELRASGIETALYQPRLPSYRHPGPWLAESWRLAREFRRRGADLLGALYAGLAGRIARLPVICHVRCCYPDLAGMSKYLWTVNRFLFVSDAALSTFAWRPAAPKGTVVYDAVEFVPLDRMAAVASVREEFGILPDRKIVGMVARIGEVKDHPTLVRAARIVCTARPGTMFLIVGGHRPENQAHYDSVRQLVRENGLEDNFLFIGHRGDAARLLAAMDVAVLCTHSEGLSLATLEAMVQGTPLVATDVGGLREVVRHGENGLLHGLENAPDLASCVLRLLDDDRLAGRLSRVATQEVLYKYRPEALLEGIEDAYRAVAGR